MTSPLVWNVASLHQQLYGWLLYPHPLPFNGATHRWEVEPRGRRLLPFYFTAFALNTFLGLGTSLFIVCKYLFTNEPDSITGFSFGISGALVGCAVFVFIVNRAEVCYTEEIVSYARALCDYEEGLGELEATSISKSPSPHVWGTNMLVQDSSQATFRNGFDPKLFFWEASKLLSGKGQKVDLVGLFLHLLVFYMALIGLVVTPLGIFIQVDPFFFVLESLPGWNPDRTTELVPLLLRNIFGYIICVQGMRTMSLSLMMIIVHSHIYLHCTRLLSSLSLNSCTISWYNQLRILEQTGDWLVSRFIPLLMGTGFFFSVLCNSFTFVGWKVFPPVLYALGSPLSIVIAFIIHTTLPTAVNCYEWSRIMIQQGWGRQMGGWKGEGEMYRLPLMKRVTISQRPVCFKSGNMARLTKETKINYYNHIWDYTVNFLLLFQSAVKEIAKGNV